MSSWASATSLSPELRQRARQAVVVERELLGAPVAERRDDPLEHLRGVAPPLRGVVGVAERQEQIAIVGDELRRALQDGNGVRGRLALRRGESRPPP